MENNELALNADAPAALQNISGERSFVRLNYSERAQHMIFAGCFFILVFTGFMLKLPEGFLTFFGEAGELLFRYRRLLHRIAGVLMILVGAYHIYYLLLWCNSKKGLVLSHYTLISCR